MQNNHEINNLPQDLETERDEIKNIMRTLPRKMQQLCQQIKKLDKAMASISHYLDPSKATLFNPNFVSPLLILEYNRLMEAAAEIKNSAYATIKFNPLEKSEKYSRIAIRIQKLLFSIISQLDNHIQYVTLAKLRDEVDMSPKAMLDKLTACRETAVNGVQASEEISQQVRRLVPYKLDMLRAKNQKVEANITKLLENRPFHACVSTVKTEQAAITAEDSETKRAA